MTPCLTTCVGSDPLMSNKLDTLQQGTFQRGAQVPRSWAPGNPGTDGMCPESLVSYEKSDSGMFLTRRQSKPAPDKVEGGPEVRPPNF
jgi:hypothetical protein